MTARTSRSELDSESAFSEVLDGAGIIGDSIGAADSQPLTTTGTTPGAPRFITGTPSTGAAAPITLDNIYNNGVELVRGIQYDGV